jgi:hypothetical protein
VCSRPSSHASPPHVRTLYRHTPRAWKTRCKDFLRLWTIPKSPHVMLVHPCHSPASRPRSYDGECRSMRRPRPGIDSPFRRLTTTDDRSESRWFPVSLRSYPWMFTSSLGWFIREIRYSERVQEEWFEVDRHWISHSGDFISGFQNETSSPLFS